jgi:hypothetical protein
MVICSNLTDLIFDRKEVVPGALRATCGGPSAWSEATFRGEISERPLIMHGYISLRVAEQISLWFMEPSLVRITRRTEACASLQQLASTIKIPKFRMGL